MTAKKTIGCFHSSIRVRWSIVLGLFVIIVTDAIAIVNVAIIEGVVNQMSIEQQELPGVVITAFEASGPILQNRIQMVVPSSYIYQQVSITEGWVFQENLTTSSGRTIVYSFDGFSSASNSEYFSLMTPFEVAFSLQSESSVIVPVSVETYLTALVSSGGTISTITGHDLSAESVLIPEPSSSVLIFGLIGTCCLFLRSLFFRSDCD